MQKLLVRIASIALLIVNSIAFAGDPPPAAGGEPPTLRLPPGARPTRYAVTLTVAPGDATAQGEIAIDVELERPHAVLWLNADTLTVTRRHRRDGCDPRLGISAVGEQFVGLPSIRRYRPGKHRVTLAFEAEQSPNSTRGIFALQDSGAWYAMTQFEAISARRRFPSFESPGSRRHGD